MAGGPSTPLPSPLEGSESGAIAAMREPRLHVMGVHEMAEGSGESCPLAKHRYLVQCACV